MSKQLVLAFPAEADAYLIQLDYDFTFLLPAPVCIFS